MRVIFSLLPLLLLAVSLPAQAAPYDPYPWCAAYGGSWSGTSNCGFKTLQQCMATVSGMGGSCEPNQFHNPGRSGKRSKIDRSRTTAMEAATAVFRFHLTTSMIDQNVPSFARVYAGDFGFFTLIHVFDGPDL
jgi:hypothetical protein